MPKVVLVVGLPGSGKTHLAIEIAAQRGCMLFDDISAEEGDGDLPALYKALAEGKDCVLTDPFLCIPDHRTKCQMMLSQHELEWIFFENDKEQCIVNAEARRKVDGRYVLGSIHRFSSLYKIPEDYTPIPVWRPDENQADNRLL